MPIQQYCTVAADEIQNSLLAAHLQFCWCDVPGSVPLSQFACMYMYSFSARGGGGCRAVCVDPSDCSGYHFPLCSYLLLVRMCACSLYKDVLLVIIMMQSVCVCVCD